MVLKAHNWDKQCKSININHLITLCETEEDYKLFCDELESLIKSKNNKDLINDAYQVMQGKVTIHTSKYKAFVKKHKNTIDIMKKYSCLWDLTVLSYDVKGNRIKDLQVDYFYEYIQKNKKDIEKIKEVALKLKELGFNNIRLGENLDFIETEYELDTLYGSDFAFLENIKVIPTYLNSPIKYKTNNSCYCMILGTNGYGDKKELNNYSREVYLNSLIIDPNSLPNEITTDSTIGIIKQMADDKKTEYSDIKNSTDLSLATSDLKNQFEYLKEIVTKINDIKDNEELINIIHQMQDIMIQLQDFGENFEQKVIDSNTSITEQQIKQEKKLCLERRYLSSIHVD